MKFWLSAVLITAVTIVVIVTVVVWLAQRRCDTVGEQSHRRTEYKSGMCFIEVKGSMIPVSAWREFDQK